MFRSSTIICILDKNTPNKSEKQLVKDDDLPLISPLTLKNSGTWHCVFGLLVSFFSSSLVALLSCPTRLQEDELFTLETRMILGLRLDGMM